MATTIYFIIILIAVLLMLFKKEKLLYYFVFLYPILPEYLAISISRTAPLLMVSRMILIILFISLVFYKKLSIGKNIFKKKSFADAFVFFLICETILFFVHRNDPDSAKVYIGVILENLIFTMLITDLVNTREKFENCITALLCGAFVVFLMGVMEPITKVNLASTYLDTGSRNDLLISSYERHNSIRAVFSFGHAIALGVYCVAILPIVIYKINTTHKMRYYVLFELGLGCLLMTMSRGVIVAFAIIFVISLFQMNASDRKVYFKILLITLCFVAIIVIIVPDVFEIVRDTVYSCLNAFGANFDVVSAGNADGVESRMSQLTMIPQILEKNALFGGGPGYIRKEDVYVYTEGRKFVAQSIDMEYLSMFVNKGIIGLVSGVVLYIGILKTARKRRKNNSLSSTFYFSLCGLYISYFTVNQLTTDRIFWMIVALMLCNENLYDYKND